MSSLMHFDETFSFEKSIHIIRDIVARLPGDNNDILQSIDRREWAHLVRLSVCYDDPTADVHSLSGRRQALAFFSKNAALPLGLDTAAIALEKFLESESICLATNRRFRNRSAPTREGGVDAGLTYEVMRKVADILGPFPGLDRMQFGFGPGANVGVSRLTSLRRKFSAKPTITPGALKYLQYIENTCPHWATLSNYEVVSGGKYASVPKSAITDRSILVEPLLNTYLQKGVGGYIRRRLLRRGINLNDQSINQCKAREGSITGSLATIDLSMASDTISREVVAALLPFDWWLFLEDIRSPIAKLPDGREIVLQKFSSMGNGFTFELESLIFFAILDVVAKNRKAISVYGDDLVIDSSDYNHVKWALEHFGFSLNSDKSFASGPFRESCGKDYFGGIDIRPCYVKGRLSIKEMFRLHNFFVRNHDEGLATCCLQHIPLRWRVYGPDGFGDGHLLGDHTRTRSRRIRSRGYGGYCFSTYQSSPRTFRNELPGDYPAFLWMATRQHCGLSEEGSDLDLDAALYQERGKGVYRKRLIYTLEV